ncbi:MAG: type 4a pilus biogenesis protein PilO [Candidatus Omnitrophica bacterium]|nr:type 4a pilus biogenesis protein PilO [Candidatus Omnitrophota bacterium]MBI2174500.1 type 4a pilus biogenesis protein PilO [Candidatus Omnitrophota bacterium]MBI3010073.1 type 4a pilus biogenesis protein PilO [Candidatus Omnitrophota bacterium]
MPALIDPRVSYGATATILGAIILYAWQFPYGSLQTQLHKTRQKLAAQRQQVEQIETILLAAGGEQAWLAAKQEDLGELRRRIPERERLPQLLDLLIERVHGAGLNVVNVTQGNAEPALDASGKAIFIEEAPCLALPVTLTLQGRYRQMVSFLENLRSAEFLGLATIRAIQLEAKSHDQPTLHAAIRLVLYITGS